MSKAIISVSVSSTNYSIYDDGLCVFTQGDDCVEISMDEWQELMAKVADAIEEKEKSIAKSGNL